MGKDVMPAQVSGRLGEELEIPDSRTAPGLVLVQGPDAADSRLRLRDLQVEKSDACKCRCVNGE